MHKLLLVFLLIVIKSEAQQRKYKINKLFSTLIFILIYSCQANSSKPAINKTERQHFIDSFMNQEQRKIDSSVKKILLDTSGVAYAPIKIMNARFWGRNVYLQWKNISNKKISAIRFSWYGENAFNEPADMGVSSFKTGFGGGFTDREIYPGKSDEGTWDIYSKDGKKLIVAWPYEVAFADGSKWKLNP